MRVSKRGPSPATAKVLLRRQEAVPDHQAFDSVDKAVRTMEFGGSVPQAKLVTSFDEGSAGMIPDSRPAGPEVYTPN